MMIELNSAERDLMKKVLDAYLSELRQAIAATKRHTSTLHAEEEQIKDLLKRVAGAV